MALGPIVSGALRALPVGAAAVAGVDYLNLIGAVAGQSSRLQERLTYPTDLLDRGEDVPYISMEFSEYSRRSIYHQPFYNTKMKICLPIPDNLIEQQVVRYNTSAELGSVVGSIAEGLSAGAPIGTRLNTMAAGVGVEAAQRLAAGALTRGIGGFALSNTQAQSVTSQSGTLLSTLMGITTNPFQTVLFQSPDFRSHSFKWNMVPKNAQESETLRQIVDTFKYHSLPGISRAGGVFFSYPEILKISIRPKDQYLYKFKNCVVDSITVNYAPNSPSFYKSTGAPTAVQFAIKLQEIEIWTKADWMRDAAGNRT